MSEMITARELTHPNVGVPMDRDEFYREQVKVFKETGAPTKAVDIVNVLIFNKNRELLVQKRNFDKNHNPGLLDKSVGGHIRYGDTPDYTVMVETVQELQTPSIVLRDENLFFQTVELLKDHLNTVAISKYHSDQILSFGRVIGGERIVIASQVYFYLSIYNGRIRPVDRESKGVLWYSMAELDREMEKFPDTFTEELPLLCQKYRKDIDAFLRKI